MAPDLGYCWEGARQSSARIINGMKKKKKYTSEAASSSNASKKHLAKLTNYVFAVSYCVVMIFCRHRRWHIYIVHRTE